MKLEFVLLAGLAIGCSSEAAPGAGVGGAGGAAAASSGGTAVVAAGNGGANSGGALVTTGAGGASAGAFGSGGLTSTAGVSGSSGAATGGNGGSGPLTFACSQFMGPNVTGEWFAAGFETFVQGDDWQVKAPHRSFVEDWAAASHDVWREQDCQGAFTECETRSKCSGDTPPDRILFVTQTGDYLGTPQSEWESSITSAIATIKQKYPSVKHVELLTFLRGPGNMDCGGETTVAAELDAAHLALAAASNGFISAGPRFAMQSCNQFSSPPHLSGAGNSYAAELIGKHYAGAN